MTGVGFTLWIPTLPGRALSPNGGRWKAWGVARAKEELGEATHLALLEGYAPAIPSVAPPVVITLTLYARHHARGGDGLYRPADPSNVGGDVAKPVIDTLVGAGVIPDDNYRVVDEVRLRVRHVDDLAEEGIMVEIVGAKV